MPQTAIVVFTARSLDEILRDGGSRDWRLDAERARDCEYLVCTQNRRNTDFGAPTAPHGAAFLIGRTSGVVRSPDDPARWQTIPPRQTSTDSPAPQPPEESGSP